MSERRITPRTLKGFRDYLPDSMRPRENLIDTARAVCRSYGFNPIDTPALEYAEILTGKGGEESDKQMYRFEDAGGRDVALRFDLTVPLARFVGQHIEELGTPFKRYHVGLAWRGENTQRGRYREFVQCDFDTIGTESTVADIETALVIRDIFAALGIPGTTIGVNSRKVLNGVLERIEASDRASAVLRALDKLAKAGKQAVADEMTGGAGLSATQTAEILSMASRGGSNGEILAALPAMVGDSHVGAAGIQDLADVVEGFSAAGGDTGSIKVDLSIARGLDYYTGTVYETVLDDLPDIGSLCSGGRYDDLASAYTKERLPGVGASLGVDRTLAAMGELRLIDPQPAAAGVLVAYFDPDRRNDYLALASELRGAGLAVEFYPDPKKLGVQLKYADRRGHRVSVIVGPREWDAGTVQVKDMTTGESNEVARGDVTATCVAILGV